MWNITRSETSTECKNVVVFDLLLVPAATYVEAVLKKTTTVLSDNKRCLNVREKEQQDAHLFLINCIT